MELKTIKGAMEAILFAYAEPLSVHKMAEILEAEPAVVEKIMQVLRDEYEQENRGIQLLRLENAWQLTTKPVFGDFVKKAMDTRRNTPLTNAALEVLAIIAYNQPVSRSFVEQVRGVDSSSIIVKLVEKGLVVEQGRLDLPGRPISYGTADNFLRTFGITSLSELPELHGQDEEQSEKNQASAPDADRLFSGKESNSEFGV